MHNVCACYVFFHLPVRFVYNIHYLLFMSNQIMLTCMQFPSNIPHIYKPITGLNWNYFQIYHPPHHPPPVIMPDIIQRIIKHFVGYYGTKSLESFVQGVSGSLSQCLSLLLRLESNLLAMIGDIFGGTASQYTGLSACLSACSIQLHSRLVMSPVIV